MSRKIRSSIRAARKSPEKILKLLMKERCFSKGFSILSHSNVNWRFFKSKNHTSKPDAETPKCGTAFVCSHAIITNQPLAKDDESTGFEERPEKNNEGNCEENYKESCEETYEKSIESVISSSNCSISVNSIHISILSPSLTPEVSEKWSLKVGELEVISIQNERHFFIDNSSSETVERKEAQDKPEYSESLPEYSGIQGIEGKNQDSERTQNHDSSETLITKSEPVCGSVKVSITPCESPKEESVKIVKSFTIKPFKIVKYPRSLSERLILHEIGIYVCCIPHWESEAEEKL